MALLGTPQKLLTALIAPGVNMPNEQREQIAARIQKGGTLKDEQQYLEKTFEQIMTARQGAFPDRLRVDELIRARVTEAVGRKLSIMGVLLPGLAGRTAKEAECLAYLRFGLAAVALEQFRAAHQNRWPAALSDLTPNYLAGTPVDPFDGRPLRYRQEGEGYLLYTIGPDLKDDSGGRLSGKEGDLVFAVVLPPGRDQPRPLLRCGQQRD